MQLSHSTRNGKRLPQIASHWLLGALALLFPVGPASLTVHAQGNESHELTLIHPDDSDFQPLLDARFPGFSSLNSYSTIRPFLVLLRNDTPQLATAYVIEWEVHVPNGLPQYF
jgi:hypothetical protein